ncbi:MAG TPA: hypothetical protein ENN42_06770, partial [Thioalkalivibrio sp.]|nr:hypothetical protein [Thioalkalivibrio sp.]
MPFACKRNEEEARERLRAFWVGTSLGRPALHAVVQDPGRHEAPVPPDEAPSVANDWSPDWHARRAAEALDGTEYLAEAMPGVALRFGSLLTVLAVLAGGEYTYHSDSAWIRPLPGIWERPLPTFCPGSDAVRGLERCLRAVADMVADRGFVNPPVLLDGLTTLSGFRTPEQLCIDVLERRDDVRRWSAALTDLYVATYRHFYAVVTAWGYGDTTTWLSAMAEGSMEAVQCDFAVMLSPRMFEDLVLPDLARTVEALDYSLYHLDGTAQLRFLDLLATIPGLNGIQWNPEPGAGSPVLWLDALRDIRRRGWCLHVNCPSVADAVRLAEELGPDGLFLVLPPFGSRQEANAA